MQPVDLDEQDAITLSPCELLVYAKDQPQYLPLPVARLTEDAPPHLKRVPVVSRWQLSAEEKARLAQGDDVYLTLYTFGNPLQPIRLTVGCPELCPGDRT